MKNKQKTFFGKLRAELFRAGYSTFHIFDADGKNHLPIFIFTVSIVEIILFFLMLGLDPEGSTLQALSYNIKFEFGALASRVIANDYSQIWRVFTNIFLHASLTHVLDNVFVQILMGWPIERKFGFWITAFIYIVSGIGGSIFSLVFESLEFSIVVGASGCACGLLGSYISDWIKNRQSIKMPIIRIVFVVISIVLLFVEGALDTTHSISNFSHLGGLFTGIFPIVNVLPNLKEERWEVVLVYVGIFSGIMEFVGLPLIYFYIVVPTILATTV